MRHLMPLSRSLLLFRLACVVAATAPFPLFAIEPTDYERELLVERRAIVQIHLEMDTDLTAGNGVQLTRSKRAIWQVGEKRRCDEIREYLDGKGVTEVPPHRLVSIETPEYFVWWDGRPQPPPTRRCAYFGTASDVNYKGYKLMMPFDARRIGLQYTFILHNRDLPWEFIIASPERAAPATVEINGDQAKVSYTRIKNVIKLTVEQVYEKRGGKYLLRSVNVGDDSEYHYRTTMECSYPDTLVAGLAMPDSIECKRVRDDFYGRGDYVEFQEKSKIRVKSVNEAIPRSRFSIVTAELPPGTPVIGDAIPPELLKPFHHIQWNGEALVPVSNSEIALPNEDDKPGRS